MGAVFVKSQEHAKILFFRLSMAFKRLLISFYCSIAANAFAQIRKISAKEFLNEISPDARLPLRRQRWMGSIEGCSSLPQLTAD